MPTKSIRESLDENTPCWMEMAGVSGTAIGQSEGRPCIKIFMAEPTVELTARIPGSVDGYPVMIEETGEFRAL